MPTLDPNLPQAGRADTVTPVTLAEARSFAPALSPPSNPLRYSPEIETVASDEDETAQAIVATMRKIQERTFADGGRALRAVHAKSHGILKAELQVLPGLPAVLAQGLFAKPGRHPAVMRFSTIPGDILPDKVSTPRGLALKILGVEGERLPGSPDETSQDLILVNGPRFNTVSAKVFLANLKLVAATTDRAEGAKVAFSAAAQAVEKLVEAFGGKSATLSALGGQQPRHILGETFFGQLPIRYGDHIAKFSLTPVSPALKALESATIDLASDQDSLRLAIQKHFALKGGEWLLSVQLCADLETMPIEDATAVWDEDQSPFIPVARLVAGPQSGWSAARSQAVDDGMGFSPWRGLAAHQPLGQMMRMRRGAYANANAFRAAHNGGALIEPKTLDDFPD